jgi:hypothetical protein
MLTRPGLAQIPKPAHLKTGGMGMGMGGAGYGGRGGGEFEGPGAYGAGPAAMGAFTCTPHAAKPHIAITYLHACNVVTQYSWAGGSLCFCTMLTIFTYDAVLPPIPASPFVFHVSIFVSV